MNSKFCPKCGSTKGPFLKGFCKKCFLAKHKILDIPESIKIIRCRKCGKINFSGKWIEQKNFNLEKILLRFIKTKELDNAHFSFVFSEENENIVVAKIKISGFIGSEPIESEKEIFLEFDEALCDSCMKTHSYYHEAIIQFRFEDKSQAQNILQEAQSLLAGFAKKDSLAKIIDVKKQGSGFDLLIGSKKSAVKTAKIIVKKYKKKIIVSSKVIGGDREGNYKKRFTFCIKF